MGLNGIVFGFKGGSLGEFMIEFGWLGGGKCIELFVRNRGTNSTTQAS